MNKSTKNYLNSKLRELKKQNEHIDQCYKKIQLHEKKTGEVYKQIDSIIKNTCVVCCSFVSDETIKANQLESNGAGEVDPKINGQTCTTCKRNTFVDNSMIYKIL